MSYLIIYVFIYLFMHSFIHALINSLVNLTGARENVRERGAVKRTTVIVRQDTTTFVLK